MESPQQKPRKYEIVKKTAFNNFTKSRGNTSKSNERQPITADDEVINSMTYCEDPEKRGETSKSKMNATLGKSLDNEARSNASLVLSPQPKRKRKIKNSQTKLLKQSVSPGRKSQNEPILSDVNRPSSFINQKPEEIIISNN
jgi:hypothetical protein